MQEEEVSKKPFSDRRRDGAFFLWARLVSFFASLCPSPLELFPDFLFSFLFLIIFILYYF